MRAIDSWRFDYKMIVYVQFSGDVAKTTFCSVQLLEQDYKAFVYAVRNNYWYQMYIDDLPIWGACCGVVRMQPPEFCCIQVWWARRT